MEEKKSFIPCRLKNAAVGGHVAGTEDIYDDSLNKNQDEINANVKNRLESAENSIEALNEQVAFEGELEVANTAAEITDNGGKIPSVKAVSEALKGIGYFECSTAASTANKTIAATGYSLRAGGSIKIKMVNANTADNATLTVGSTEAKALYYDGSRAGSENSWEAGEVVDVYYDGTSFYANNVLGGGKFLTGEKVKEVSIINNLTSGGATNVLSAEQGKTLYTNSLFEQNNRGNINSSYKGALRSNTWVVSSYTGHKAFINDTRFDRILIQANSNSKNYVAFLKTHTYPIVNESEADFCENTTVIEISANKVSILDVPSDCAYIIVSNSNNSTPWQLPQRVSYINDVDEEVQVLKDEVESIISGQDVKTSEPILQLTWNVGYRLDRTDDINAASGWNYCDYVDVSSYKKLRLKGFFGGNYGLNMYDENHNVMRFYAPSNEASNDVVVDIPQYCKYVRYCVKSNNPASNSSVAAFVYQSFNATALREEYTAKYNELYGDTVVEKLPEIIDLGTIITGQYRNGTYGNTSGWRCTENMVDIHVYTYLLTSGFYGSSYGLEFYDVDGNRIGHYYGSSEVSHTEYKVTIPEGVYYCRYSTKGTTIGTLKGIQYVSTTHQDIQDDITRIENMFVNAGYRYLAGNYGISEENEDNTPALQALVDTVNSEGGGIIEMPVGSFNFKNGIVWRSNVYLVGQGEGVTTLNMVGTNAFSLFSGDNLNNIGMTDFSVIASTMAANIGGKAMFMRYIEDAVFENLKLVDTQLTSFGIDFLNNVKIVNIHVINGGRGRWTASPSGVGCSGIGIGMGWTNHKENFIISNCICYGCYNNGIFVEDQGRFASGGTVMADGSGQIISNCVCRGGRNAGFSIWGGKNVIFANNISYENANAGFEIGYYAIDGTFVGNQSQGNGTGFKIGSIQKSSSHIRFTNNEIKGNTTGVNITTADLTNYIVIKDNDLYNNGTAMSVSGNSTGLVIRDNNEYGSTTGVTLSGTHTNAIIKGNAFMTTAHSTATFAGETSFVEQLN